MLLVEACGRYVLETSCLGSIALPGASIFPFYRRRGRHGLHERERDISEEEEGPQGHGAHHLLYAGPINPIDDNGDDFMSWPYSSLALYVGVVSWSWRSIPSQQTVWLAETSAGGCTGSR